MLTYSQWPTDAELHFQDPTEAKGLPTLLEELQLSMTSQRHSHPTLASKLLTICEVDEVVEDSSLDPANSPVEADDLQPRASHLTLWQSNMHDPSTMQSSTYASSRIKNPIEPADGAAGQRGWFDRCLRQSDLHWRMQSVHSSVAREVIAEVSGELKETHDALMKCLYSTTEPKETNVRNTGEPRWSPSDEELRGQGIANKKGEVCSGGIERLMLSNDRSDDEVRESAVVSLRGGGVQGFFGLATSRVLPSAPQRPQLISRPSEAFDEVEKQGSSNTTISSPARMIPTIRTMPMGSQGSRLRQLQQSNMLRPSSLVSIDGSHSFLGYQGTASIVPEGSVASYSMGFQNPPATMHELEASEESRAQIDHVSQVPIPLAHEGHGPLSGAASTRKAEVFRTSERKEKNLAPGPMLGSPMESPAQNTWRNFSRPPTVGSVASTGHKAEDMDGISDPQDEPRKTFFAPEGRAGVARATPGSPQKSRHGSPMRSQNTVTKILDPNTAVPSDIHGSSWLATDISKMAADRSHRSLWNGGDHLSIAPGDSPSEVGAVRAEQAALKRRTERGPMAGVVRGRVEERMGVHDPRAKVESEDQFREALRRMWSTHQTRMRLINEDVMKTGEEKKVAAKEEQRYLELEIAQASTDTGFEQLHEPWQKDVFIKNLFGTRAKPSKAPSFLRKTNKVMKWILAVPDDPDLKTHSSRRPRASFSKTKAVLSNPRGNRTDMTEAARAGSSRVHRSEMQYDREQEGAPRALEARRQFHFAPVPAVHGKVMHQESFETLGDSSGGMFGTTKAGKVSYKPSMASSETGWPTQSQAGGKE